MALATELVQVGQRQLLQDA